MKKAAVLAVLIQVAMPLVSSAQGAFPPKSFTNLEVLPKDAGPAVVVGLMKGFTQALGVRCQHCHVGEEGMPLDRFDFPSDAKPAKATARAMMRMVAEINATLDREVPTASSGARVSCATCHGGRVKPAR